MLEMASGLGPESGVRVPFVYRKFCTRRILVQERFDGTPVTDAAELEAEHRQKLAGQLLATTIDQVMKRGFFHADPHPGNMFALDDGSLGLIDFGAVGRLGPIEQRAIIDMFVALARRDVGLAARGRRAAHGRRPRRRRTRSWSGRSGGCWRSTSGPVAARSIPP